MRLVKSVTVIGLCQHSAKSSSVTKISMKKLLHFSSHKKVFAPVATEFPNILLMKVVWKTNKEHQLTDSQTSRS
jgi:hypothetical protein